MKVNQKAMIRKQYNQVAHLARDTIWESDKNTRKNNPRYREEISPFPAGDHKAARNRQDNITKTNIKSMEWLVKILEGLNMLNGTKLILSSDVD